jgi:pimeloyl-ACP methyl ester carboxylesterase
MFIIDALNLPKNNMQHLLLLHGALGAADQFQPLVAALSDRYHVHTLNFKGHGGEQDVEKFTIPLFAEQLGQYLQEHAIHKINLFGYSMGGYVALYFGKQHPGRIHKIFTFATKFLWTPEIAQQEIKMLNAAKITEKLPAFAETLEKRHSPYDWKKLLQKTADLMIALGTQPPLNDATLEQLEIPVLVGLGDKDTMVTLEETIHVYRKLKNANLMVMPGTPHPIEKVNIEALAAVMSSYFIETAVTVSE